MADAVLTTKLSRRTMLSGGVSAAGLSLGAMPAAFPAPIPAASPMSLIPLMPPAEGRRRDAELLRRLGAAAAIWERYLRLDAHCLRLLDAMRRRPDWPAAPYSEAGCRAVEALAARTGYRAACDECEVLYERHEAALAAAFAVPARTVAGLRDKMRRAVAAAKERDGGTFEESDYRWIDIAMGDLERIAADGATSSFETGLRPSSG